ncbi:NFX1-type zinc finger-containing protein 1 isoform X2 [Halyomorpha halys]|uniref:NFX1-type zinc finger-containing protein 1 isoform X2 n=1 Tax=Halyomorpha halys TaxID=286706 RepID=UPI0006D4E12F|nr:NFX1-type zinc finger-containing protein 1-like isoform X2 [Halyomorpha halys]
MGRKRNMPRKFPDSSPLKMEPNEMTLRQTAELLASEINIKSLLCLYSTSDLNKITSMLLKRKLELQLFFKSDFSSELIDVLRSLVPIYNLPNELANQKSEILSTTHCEEFLESIRLYLLGVKKLPRNRSKLLEELHFIILYLDVNVNEIPPSSIHYNRFWSVLKVFHETLLDRGFQSDNLVLWISELMQLIEKKSLYINRKDLCWRECSAYPHPVDIFESKDLIPNKTLGAYKDFVEYLNIHFKLYKEDFESNLREGLLHYKAKLRGASFKENLELHVYNRVRVESIEVDKSAKNGFFHKVTIVVGNKEEPNDINKFFMNGSLLLFSEYSQFSTFILAILVDVLELPEEQRKWSKALKVSVIGDPSWLKVGHCYTMIEPKTFFEPYHQVLKVLQVMDSQSFPMMKYIVHADVSPCMPGYINVNTEYSIDGKTIKLFGKDKWPRDLLNLNFQQIEALQTSLTHEFVLIQGPPGTGKTYLAQNIINILIQNKHFSTPILLISSKNDSVDRILEPLAMSGRKVVRLGGQSKSAILKKCTVSNLIKRVGGREMIESINNLKDTIKKKIDTNEKINEELNSFNREQKLFLEFREREDAHQLLSAGVEVIGGTTAGCARLRCMLDNMQPEVTIVEDANEVLEPHVVASLSKGCKHVILLGDHKQLQPNVASKDGSEKYNLDVSLFERMGRCGMKCSVLREQRRMRPEIASLLSPVIYPNMLNHPRVNDLPNVKGMKKNVFFINHDISEEKAAKSNPAIKNIEIHMIDSYSGQENRIILLSLVRSQSSAIGFLSSNNRIAVALSRAECGLYIIGNMKTLMNGSQLWSSINEVLQQQNGIGKSIELKCQNHQTITSVNKAEDFKNGGCNVPCKSKLECGHLCKLTCHPLADGHKNYKCKNICSRLCPRKIHRCKKKCSEQCGPCRELSERQLPCGHHLRIPCFENDFDYVCVYPTEVMCLCFGQLTVPCSEADSCFYTRVEV